MTPVQQTKLYSSDGIHSGNCFAACLASLLDIPLWMVPPFEDMFGRHADSYMERANEWLGRFFSMRLVRTQGWKPSQLPAFCMACGSSWRGVHHAVIYGDGSMVHDPHPSNAGLRDIEFTYHLERR